MLTTLSGDELLQLRVELELIKEPFSLVEFDDEDVDERKGDDSDRRKIGDIIGWLMFLVFLPRRGWLRV